MQNRLQSTARTGRKSRLCRRLLSQSANKKQCLWLPHIQRDTTSPQHNRSKPFWVSSCIWMESIQPGASLGTLSPEWTRTQGQTGYPLLNESSATLGSDSTSVDAPDRRWTEELTRLPPWSQQWIGWSGSSGYVFDVVLFSQTQLWTQCWPKLSRWPQYRTTYPRMQLGRWREWLVLGFGELRSCSWLFCDTTRKQTNHQKDASTTILQFGTSEAMFVTCKLVFWHCFESIIM